VAQNSSEVVFVNYSSKTAICYWFLPLYMSQQQRLQVKTQVIRDTIKAVVAQLDCWETDKREQDIRRAKANARYPRGTADRQALAQHRARTTLQTHGLQDPPCNLCGSVVHLTDEYDSVVREGRTQADPEDPSIGIHRAILHRLYLQVCDLYRLSYPNHCPSSRPIADGPSEAPDYLRLGISQAVADLFLLPGLHPQDIRQRHSSSFAICQLYYSKAFPVGFTNFCEQVATSFEQHLH
jgi:hypothetical protein